MRSIINFLGGIIAAIVVIIMAIFVIQNTTGQNWHFLSGNFTANMGWVAGGAFILGFALAFLVLLPGRVASSYRGWSLGRQHQRTTQELEGLRAERERLGVEHDRLGDEHQRLGAEHARLLSDHRQVLAERDQMRTRLAAVAAATTARPTSPVTASTPAPTPAPARAVDPTPVAATAPASIDGTRPTAADRAEEPLAPAAATARPTPLDTGTRHTPTDELTPARAGPADSAQANMAPSDMAPSDIPPADMAPSNSAAPLGTTPADTVTGAPEPDMTPETPARPTLGERLRGLFGPQQEPPPDQTAYPEGPTAPTA